MTSEVFSKLINLVANFCLYLFQENYLNDAKKFCEKAIEFPPHLLSETKIDFTYDKNSHSNLDFSDLPSFFLSLSNIITMSTRYDNNRTISFEKLSEAKLFSEQIRVDLLSNLINAQKFGQIRQQWQNLKNLGDYYLNNKNISLAVTYYQIALTFIQQHPQFKEEQNISLVSLDLAMAEFIYQHLPKDNDYEQGLIVSQICKARLRDANDIKMIFRYILSIASCFAKATRWQEAWHCVRCLLVWIAQKPWNLDSSILVDLTTVLSHIAARNLAFFQDAVNLINQPNGEYKHSLQVLRERLKENLAVTNVLDTHNLINHFTNGLRDILQKILKDCMAILGQPPCDYAILALGSLARNEACPYSDLEFAILVSDISKYAKERAQEIAAIKNYFKALIELFESKIIQLGESPPPITDGNVLYSIKKGLCFDDGGNVPFKKKILFGDSTILLGNMRSQGEEGIPGDIIAANVLQEAALLLGDQKLFNLFCQEKRELIYH